MDFASEGLEHCVNNALQQQPGDPVTVADLASLRSSLVCDDTYEVTSFDGIEGAGVNRIMLYGGTHALHTADALAGLAGLERLSTLELVGPSVNDAALAAMPQLSRLSKLLINDNPDITSAAGIEQAPALTYVQLQGDPQLVDISALAQLPQLQTMSVIFTAVSELPEFPNSPALRTLTVSNAQLTSLVPLRGLQDLRSLTVTNNQLTSLDGIEGMSALTRLHANQNPGLGDDIQAIAGLTLLDYVELENARMTTIEPLRGLTNLTNLFLRDNRIASIEGLPEPAGTSGVFWMMSQNLDVETAYVPNGATEFRRDAEGDVKLRDGSFPQLSENPDLQGAPEYPKMKFLINRTSCQPGGPAGLHYKFRESSADDKDVYSGTVRIPCVFTEVVGPIDPSIDYGVAWSADTVLSDAFPATSFSLAGDVPAWLSLNASTGEFTGTPDEYGSWDVVLHVADRMGNTMTHEFTIEVPELEKSQFSIATSTPVVTAGDNIELEVRHTASEVDPRDEPVSVKLRVAASDALGESALVEDGELELNWDPSSSAYEPVQHVTVPTIAGTPGTPATEVTFELEEPAPVHLAELGEEKSVTSTILYADALTEEAGAGNGGKDTPTRLARTGSAGLSASIAAGGIAIIVAAVVLLTRRQMRS